MAKLTHIGYRCWACDERVSVKALGEPMPRNWERHRCLMPTEVRPVTFWICPRCAETRETSLALVALRYPIISRILPGAVTPP